MSHKESPVLSTYGTRVSIAVSRHSGSQVATTLVDRYVPLGFTFSKGPMGGDWCVIRDKIWRCLK